MIVYFIKKALGRLFGILPIVYACNNGVFAFKFPFFKRGGSPPAMYATTGFSSL